MRLSNKKKLFSVLMGAAVLIVGAYEGLIHPKNYFSRLFRGPVTDIGDKVILGPYPGEDDFKFLAEQKIGTIVSLLDARLPYEGEMLEQERARAASAGIRLLNFPLGSVLGQHYGADFDAQAQAAAEAIAAAPGRVYMHCYLGRHRAVAVQEKLAALGTKAVSIGAGDRSPALLLNDQGWAKLNAGDNRGVLDLMAGKPDLNATSHVIAGWAHYRMGELAPALEAFRAALALEPANVDARGGLGYVAMAQNRLDDADKEFAGALAQAPDDLQSLVGTGLLRNRQGRAREAADFMEKVLRLEPRNEEARGVLGRIDPRRLQSLSSAGR